MHKTVISLFSLISIFFSIIIILLFSYKSDDTLVIEFKREITNLDYHYGTKTEYLILADMIDDSSILCRER